MKIVSKCIVGAGVAVALTLSSGVFTAAAEELDPIFTKVKELVTQQNYSKALEELKWASKEIEKLNAKKVETFFPDTLNGYAGEKINSTGVMGMTNVERKYKKGADTFTITLTNLGGGAGGALGGLAQLGSMASMFGGANSGMDSVRVAGKTAQVDTTGSEPKMTVFLDGGSILALEAGGKTSVDDLKKSIEAFKIEDLEKYLKGA